jgi:hypothetical protein
MKSKRPRLALLGVLALALSVTVGVVSGSVADAKKKGTRKKGGSVTVSQTTPTTIPVGSTSDASITTVPLTVGKKAKGKVVGADSVAITTTFAGSSAGFAPNVKAELTAPNGRTAFLNNPPMDSKTTVSGPVTETPDSPLAFCIPPTVSPQRCGGDFPSYPEETVGPPYAGTIGNLSLAAFMLVRAKGTWTVKVFNKSTTTTAVLNSVTLFMRLKTAP